MVEIRDGDLSDPAVRGLVRLHLDGMAEHSPPESIHALDVDRLAAPGISLWTAWEGGTLLGFGALRELDSGHGEIKSMRTTPAALRRGVGAAILDHIIAVARARGYRRLSLETGSAPAFEPALSLYRGFGFTDCSAFGDYPPGDSFSRFMSRAL